MYTRVIWSNSKSSSVRRFWIKLKTAGDPNTLDKLRLATSLLKLT